MHLAPGVDEVPVWVVLLQVLGVAGGGPVHEVEVHIVGLEVLEGRGNALLDTLVPWVVELGGEPNLFSGYARVDYALAYFGFVAISKSAGRAVSKKCDTNIG